MEQDMGEMEQYTGYDPGTYLFLKDRKIFDETTNWYRQTNHIYKLKPVTPNVEIVVKATDPFGNTWVQTQFIESIDEFIKYVTENREYADKEIFDPHNLASKIYHGSYNFETGEP